MNRKLFTYIAGWEGTLNGRYTCDPDTGYNKAMYSLEWDQETHEAWWDLQS
jgi:hypothetical protein